MNHLANKLLVLLLTPALRKANKVCSLGLFYPVFYIALLQSRVVIVASDVHFWTQTPLPDDPRPVTTALTDKSIYCSTRVPNEN